MYVLHTIILISQKPVHCKFNTFYNCDVFTCLLYCFEGILFRRS